MLRALCYVQPRFFRQAVRSRAETFYKRSIAYAA